MVFHSTPYLPLVPQVDSRPPKRRPPSHRQQDGPPQQAVPCYAKYQRSPANQMQNISLSPLFLTHSALPTNLANRLGEITVRRRIRIHRTNNGIRARKEFTHQNLFAEVISQLAQRFKPDLNMMKRRIESLIEREYLERVEDANTPTYRYLA